MRTRISQSGQENRLKRTFYQAKWEAKEPKRYRKMTKRTRKKAKEDQKLSQRGLENKPKEYLKGGQNDLE